MKKSRSALAALTLIFTGISINSASAAPLYQFTTAGATGISGPTQVQINSAYTNTTLASLVTINTQGIQEWTVPSTGEYWVEIAGASGGYTPGALGGKGRIIKVKVNLTAGNLLKILVGQEGGREQFTTGYAGGGGGGTYLYNATTSSYIAVAGGGGGAAQGNTQYVSTQAGVAAAAYNSTSGTSGTGYSGSYGAAGTGGTNGGAGTTNGGAPGAGISANAANGAYGGIGGTKFLSGGTGGANGKLGSVVATLNVPGGFGGGGGASIYDPYEAIGGGGGGYSGGGSGATRIGAGGGGGNYYTGTYVSDSLNTGDGFLKIQLVALPTVNMEISGNPSLVKKGEVVNLLATIDEAGTLTFFADGKRIPGCINRSANVGTFTCNWKPAIQGSVKLKVSFKQAGSEVANAQRSISVTKRTSTR